MSATLPSTPSSPASSASWPAWSPRSAASWPKTPPAWPASTALDRQVTELTRRLAGDDGDQRDDHGGDDGGYQPRPAPAWWKLPPDERRVPTAELRDWVEHVYRPGYGHLAASLSPCWPEHDLCLYGLDIASQLWCALYLQPARSTALLSAQAEYQVRVLPALAAQLAAETARCDRHPAGGYPRSAR